MDPETGEHEPMHCCKPNLRGPAGGSWLSFFVGAALGGGLIYAATRKIGPFGPLLSGFGESALSKEGLANALAVHVRQIRRYAFASSQDKSPVVGITHASYALILLETLEEIVGSDAIRRAGYDPGKLKKFITGLQDMHADKLKACDSHLQNILAIERAEGGPTTPGFVVAGAPTGA